MPRERQPPPWWLTALQPHGKRRHRGSYRKTALTSTRPGILPRVARRKHKAKTHRPPTAHPPRPGRPPTDRHAGRRVAATLFWLRGLPRSGGARRVLLGTLAIVFSVLAARAVLVTHAPTSQEPGVLTAIPPAKTFHPARSGAVVGLVLDVSSCTAPVRGTMYVGLPARYVREEREASLGGKPPARPLFSVASSDSSIRFTGAVGDEPDYHPPTFIRAFNGNPRIPRFFDHGQLIAARMDRWATGHRLLGVSFTAQWLRPHGYHSCWLEVPELVSANAQTLADHAVDGINSGIGAAAGASVLDRTELSTDFSITYTNPDGSRRTETEHSSSRVQWAELGEPTSAAYVAIRTPLAVDTSQSRGAQPSLGVPRWHCAASSDAATFPSGTSDSVGIGSDFGWRFDPEASPSTYARAPADLSPGCASVLALEENGADTGRDVWLLIIGATLSLGVALLVDAAVNGLGVRREQDTPTVSA